VRDSWPGEVPVLTDGTVTLRAHLAGDAAGMTEQCTDPDTLRFTSVPRPYSQAEARAFLALIRQSWRDRTRASGRYWAITPASGPHQQEFAGTINYGLTSQGFWEVGYGLHPAFRGHGFAARALALVAERVFTAEGAEYLLWRATVGNWASRRTAWRCGFLIEGQVRGLCPGPDGMQDGWIGSLHRDDPRAPAEPWPDGAPPPPG
jgi:RimJ/RimL family protein N-acetyltransferase